MDVERVAWKVVSKESLMVDTWAGPSVVVTAAMRVESRVQIGVDWMVALLVVCSVDATVGLLVAWRDQKTVGRKVLRSVVLSARHLVVLTAWKLVCAWAGLTVLTMAEKLGVT